MSLDMIFFFFNQLSVHTLYPSTYVGLLVFLLYLLFLNLNLCVFLLLHSLPNCLQGIFLQV